MNCDENSPRRSKLNQRGEAVNHKPWSPNLNTAIESDVVRAKRLLIEASMKDLAETTPKIFPQLASHRQFDALVERLCFSP